MEEQVKKVKKFIEDNKLDFSGRGSELNGNCTTLAGFICYVLDEDPEEFYYKNREDIIDALDISSDAEEELRRVFEYAYNNNYEKFWKTPAAKKEYIF
jgi:hypothetical protein